jgi:hypothetical protein
MIKKIKPSKSSATRGSESIGKELGEIIEKKGSKIGRPREISKEICEELSLRLIHVGSLRQVCKADDMPCRRSVFNWLSKAEGNDAPQIYRDFLHQYEAAREWAIDFSFDELEHQLREIALVPVMVNDKETGELIPLVVKGEVIKIPTSLSIAMAKLHWAAYKWKVARENPKKYGDKIRQEHAVKDGTKLSIPVGTEIYVSPGDVSQGGVD